VSRMLTSSGVMPAGFAMSEIAYLGLVVEAAADLLATTPFTLFNEVSERIKSGTSGAGIYMGVYSNDQLPSHTCTLRLLASTPTLPKGIQTIVAAAQREGSALRDKLTRSVASLDLGEIADFDLLPARSGSTPPAGGAARRGSARPSRRTQSMNARNQLDVSALGQAFTPRSPEAAPQRAPEPVLRPSQPEPANVRAIPSEPVLRLTQPEPAPVRPIAAEPVPRPAAAEPALRSSARAPVRAMSTPAPAPVAEDHSDPTADVGDRSEPETYDRLVDAFLNTESESIRRRIATRLHSSRNSDHPLARFYANRAIERLVDAGEEQALENVMSQIGAE